MTVWTNISLFLAHSPEISTHIADVAPNPAVGGITVHVDWRVNPAARFVQFSLYDLVGRRVAGPMRLEKASPRYEVFQVSAEALTAGVYVARFIATAIPIIATIGEVRTSSFTDGFVMLLRSCIILLLALVTTVGSSHGQCCSPGNPIGGGGVLGVLPAGKGRVIVNYAYSRSGAYYDGTKKVDPVFVESGFFHHARLEGAYGISKRVTAQSEVTYFISKVQEYVEGSRPSSRRGFGIGDWSGTLHLSVFRAPRRRWEVTSGLGLKIPIGTYRQKRDGGLLPHTSSGSGTHHFPSSECDEPESG